MKIGLISPYDWSYPGGVRTHIERLAEELRNRGHVVRIITAASGSNGQTREDDVIKFGWAAPLHFNGSVARVAMTPDISGALRRLIALEKFDVIHLHEPFVSTLTLAILRIARNLNIACVGTFHASTNKRTSTAALAYRMASPFLRASFRRLDASIAVSDAARNHVARFFDTDFHVIPNGINIERYTQHVQPIPEYDDGKRNVLFLTRMEPRKGLRYLLKVIPLVRQTMAENGLPPVRFILAGDGPQRARFERFVEKQGWEDVIFTGYVSDAAKMSYFASAYIYCAPSTGNESQGITLLEAMAAGVAVVASDIPGYRTVITSSDYGELTPPRDSDRLAWAICHLLRDDQRRQKLAINGRRRAESYNWKRITDEIEQVYDESRSHARERQLLQHRSYRYVRNRLRRRIDDNVSLEQPGAISSPIIRIAETSGWMISPFDENVVE